MEKFTNLFGKFMDLLYGLSGAYLSYKVVTIILEWHP